MIIETALVAVLVLSAAVVMIKDLVHAVIILAISDTLIAFVFYLMAAPDIAITQAAVVAGLSTMIFLVSINKTRRME